LGKQGEMDGKVSIRLINRNGNKMKKFLKLIAMNIPVFLGVNHAVNSLGSNWIFHIRKWVPYMVGYM